MKKILVYTLVLITMAFACTKPSQPIVTPPPPPPPQPVDTATKPVMPADVHLQLGLLAYFNFSGNWADSSGNGNMADAVSSSVFLTTDKNGHANSAMGGTGNGERLIVSNNGSILFDTAFTISIDVMMHTYGSHGFASMVNRSTAAGCSFGFGLGIPGDNRVNFAVAHDTLTCNDMITELNESIDSSNLVMDLNKWYNMIAIYHKGTQKIYANGHLLVTKTGSTETAAFCPTSQFIIGGWWDGDPQANNGSIDNVRLYNRVLNDNEIAELAKDFQ